MRSAAYRCEGCFRVWAFFGQDPGSPLHTVVVYVDEQPSMPAVELCDECAKEAQVEIPSIHSLAGAEKYGLNAKTTLAVSMGDAPRVRAVGLIEWLAGIIKRNRDR